MLGFSDFWVFLAYTGSILVTALCVVYGIVNWNRPFPDEEKREIEEELEWEKKDPELGDLKK